MSKTQTISFLFKIRFDYFIISLNIQFLIRFLKFKNFELNCYTFFFKKKKLLNKFYYF